MKAKVGITFAVILSVCIQFFQPLMVAAGPVISPAQQGNANLTFRMLGGADDPDRIAASLPSRYKVFLLSPYHISIATKIRQANPEAVIYMYKDASSARYNSADPTSVWCNPNGGTVGHDWGVDYCDANSNHPNWFLTKAGSRFEYASYQYHWHTDVGASGYKERWASNVLDDLRSNPVWDGVLIDNMLVNPNIHIPGGGPSDQYPTIASGQAAYKQFADYVGAEITGEGYGVVSNMADARLYPGIWDSYSQISSGGYDEAWTTFGGSDSNPNNLPVYSNGWNLQIQESEGFANSGKMGIFSAQTSGGSCNVCAVYGFASYLLANDGRQTFIESNYDLDGQDYQATRPMYSWQLGTALTPRTEIQGDGSNLFERRFTDGLVIVNADSDQQRVVTLPRQYRNETGQIVTTVTLDPMRATILRALSPTPATPGTSPGQNPDLGNAAPTSPAQGAGSATTPAIPGAPNTGVAATQSLDRLLVILITAVLGATSTVILGRYYLTVFKHGKR